MQHKPSELITDANRGLELLTAGNKRYIEEKFTEKKNYQADRDILVKGQSPFAVVVCCSDSRVPPEIFFDQKLGDIFVVRNAGNVVDQTALGSIEYALDHLKSPLVVVCGHSHCGAVGAAMEGGDLPENIKSITDRIQPAVMQGGTAEEVAKNNARLMAKEVEADIAKNSLKAQVVAACYDIHTGSVEWLQYR